MNRLVDVDSFLITTMDISKSYVVVDQSVDPINEVCGRVSHEPQGRMRCEDTQLTFKESYMDTR